MNKIAEVHFAYQPKNDDELELNVGDKIEIIGIEEEGWWKGKLKGRIGVFPSNFVVVESAQPSASPSSIHQEHRATSNKLNSIFGSKLGSKSSLSSNSLNTINSTSNNSLNNNYTQAGNSNNLTTIMSNNINTQQQTELPNIDSHNQNESYDESNNNSFSERKPKPVRGIGYGDIFAAGAKPKLSQSIESSKAAIGSIVASERLNNSLVGSTLQKPVPKKPPPPTPSGNNHDQPPTLNGSTSTTSDQAPALPPKPSNQSLSPFMQQSRLLQQQQHQQSAAPLNQRGQAREQARVIHAYDPSNDDELELKVNDIINIIDKKSEDHGWWKGELNGKIGVFPDNFVQLITVHNQQMPAQSSSSSMANQSDWPTNRIGPSISTTNAATSSVFSPPHQQQITSTEGRVKSVFSSTPKGFSKELESNLEKHNSNPASFLSLKRNKLSGQSITASDSSSTTANNMNMGFVSSAIKNETNVSNQNGHPSLSSNEADSPTKLNHITANRAKGPSRRPPSNVLNRRNQATLDSMCQPLSSSVLRESTSDNSLREEQPSIIGLPAAQLITSATAAPTMPNNHHHHEALPTLPNESPTSLQQVTDTNKQSPIQSGPVSGSPFTSSPASTQNGSNVSPSSIRPSSINNATDSSNQLLFGGAISMATPKTSQRIGQQAAVSDNGIIRGNSSGQKTPTSATGSPPTSTPPWMVNLRKTNAEKKREPASTSSSIPTTPIVSQAAASATTVSTTTTTTTTTSTGGSLASSSVAAATNNNGHNTITTSVPVTESLTNGQHINESANDQYKANTVSANNTAAATANIVSLTQFNESLAKYDNLYKKISKDVTNGLSELKNDVKQLQEDLKGMNDLRVAIDSMKVELKACQNATENQRKYIKELINNLADERKKIASMQVELERNLK